MPAWDTATMARDATLYFHSPCFDGIASAVIARRYLTTNLLWPEPVLRPVNYDVRAHWMTSGFGPNVAVVDFLFHPEAKFWADHHPTTFASSRGSTMPHPQGVNAVFDASAPSCAGLLQKTLRSRGAADSRFDPLAFWADQIDSARFSSLEEAVFPRAAATTISSSLSLASADDCIRLVNLLTINSLEVVAGDPDVSARAGRVSALTKMGLDRMKDKVRVSSAGVAVFDVDERGVLINRYAPYFFARGARYSAGLVQSEKGFRVSTMRNPWMDFRSVHLGRICERLGGGGHERVGSISLGATDAPSALHVLHEVVAGIEKEEARVRTRSLP